MSELNVVYFAEVFLGSKDLGEYVLTSISPHTRLAQFVGVLVHWRWMVCGTHRINVPRLSIFIFILIIWIMRLLGEEGMRCKIVGW